MEPVSPAAAPDARTTVHLVVDADDPDLVAALARAFAPHRVHRQGAATTGAAVRAVADVAAGVVVVAPATPREAADVDLHDHLALRVRRWVAAAGVVGARVVLVSTDEVVDPGNAPSGGRDEFLPADAVDPVGRARRAGEGQLGPGDTLVRVAAADDPQAIADLVRWAALAVEPGVWHLPDGTSAVLHADHTRAVRSVVPSPPADPEDAPPGDGVS